MLIYVPKLNCRIFIIKVSLVLSMLRRVLAHLIILSLTVLPVQVISAAVEFSSMQMSMINVVQNDHKSSHSSAVCTQENSKMSCCDNVSHQCESCADECPQAASAMIILPAYTADKIYSLSTQKFFTSHLLLNGVPQSNLLRPPRTLI